MKEMRSFCLYLWRIEIRFTLNERICNIRSAD